MRSLAELIVIVIFPLVSLGSTPNNLSPNFQLNPELQNWLTNHGTFLLNSNLENPKQSISKFAFPGLPGGPIFEISKHKNFKEFLTALEAEEEANKNLQYTASYISVGWLRATLANQRRNTVNQGLFAALIGRNDLVQNLKNNLDVIDIMLAIVNNDVGVRYWLGALVYPSIIFTMAVSLNPQKKMAAIESAKYADTLLTEAIAMENRRVSAPYLVDKEIEEMKSLSRRYKRFVATGAFSLVEGLQVQISKDKPTLILLEAEAGKRSKQMKVFEFFEFVYNFSQEQLKKQKESTSQIVTF